MCPEDDVPEDLLGVLLGEDAQAEHDRVAALERKFQDQQEDGAVEEPSSSSSRKRKKATATDVAAPVAAEGKVEASSARDPSHFQKRVGIQGLARVQRKGVKCMHCLDEVPKNEFRFVLAFKTSKPPRSIHTECLAQMSPEAVVNSIAFLKAHQDGKLSAAENDICCEALESLEALAPA